MLALLLALSPAGVRAQEPAGGSDAPLQGPELVKAEPKYGHALARKLCVSCHAVEPEPGTGPVQSDIPSFKSIANRRGQTRERLLNWLTLPHPPMPNIGLSRQEIRDLGAYLISLRSESAQ